MAGSHTVPVVLVGRYTTFSGSASYTTTPIKVEQYESIELFVWRSDMANASWTFTLDIEESLDRQSWSVVAGATAVPADLEQTLSGNITRSWLRLKIGLGNTAPGDYPVATSYAVGFLIKRRR